MDAPYHAAFISCLRLCFMLNICRSSTKVVVSISANKIPDCVSVTLVPVDIII